MVKSNRGAPRRLRSAARHAAELKGLCRDACTGRNSDRCSPGPAVPSITRDCWVGFAHAPRVGRLIEYLAAKTGGTRWEPIELRYRDRRVVIGGETGRLAPADFAFYAVSCAGGSRRAGS